MKLVERSWAPERRTSRSPASEPGCSASPPPACAVALGGLTRIGLDATAGWTVGDGISGLALATMSLIWALFGAALFARGVSTRDPIVRWEALAIFAVTIAKVCTFDLAGLGLTYRILALPEPEPCWFVSSAWYTRSLRAAATPTG